MGSLLLLDKVVLPDNVDKSQSSRSLASASVGGVFYKYLEILEIRPKLRKLKDELSKNLFSQDSKRESTKGKTFEDLLDIIQASDEELKHGLKYYESVQVDGEWFLLDQDYQMIVLSRILKYFDENSWNLDNVHKIETVSTLSSLEPEQVLSQVFDMFCDPRTGDTEDEFSLNKDKVSRFYGDYLLAVNSGYVLSEFLEMWQKAVPEGVVTNIDHLKGLVLINNDHIKRFPEDDLPISVVDRLNALFSAHDKWTLNEISPFIEPLTTKKLNVNALLTKFARPINSDGVKYFCSKHGR